VILVIVVFAIFAGLVLAGLAYEFQARHEDPPEDPPPDTAANSRPLGNVVVLRREGRPPGGRGTAARP
jgi:hypothetical protein